MLIPIAALVLTLLQDKSCPKCAAGVRYPNQLRTCPVHGSVLVTKGSSGVKVANPFARWTVQKEIEQTPGITVAIQLSRDGRTLFVAADGMTVQTYDTTTWSTGQTLTFSGAKSDAEVHAVGPSPDGRSAVVAGTPNEARILTLGGGELPLKGHEGEIYSAVFSPDGSVVATGAWDDTVRLWRAKDGKLLRTLTDHGSTVAGIAFSPSGNQMVTGSWDKSAIIWDVAAGTVRRKLTGHSKEVNDVDWSPQGGRVATAADDGTAKIYDASTGALLRTLAGHKGCVRTVKFSPDGRSVATGADDGLRIWDVATGTRLFLNSNNGQTFWDVVWSRDGKRIFAGSVSGVSVFGG